MENNDEVFPGISDDRLSLAANADTKQEELGAIAVQRSDRISVVGPDELEVAILKPVLAGRRSVIKVDFEHVNRPDKAVVASVSADHVNLSE